MKAPTIPRRGAIGPEFAFLRGANDEHDWTLTANATVDLIPDDPSVPRRVVPYLAVGGGYLSQTIQVGTGPFTSGQGTSNASLTGRRVQDVGWGRVGTRNAFVRSAALGYIKVTSVRKSGDPVL